MSRYSIPPLSAASASDTPTPRHARYGLPAALVLQSGFTWACTGVSVALVTLHAAGLSLWPCPFLSLTGLPCPGCGLTRSCACLLRGQFSQSLDHHLFGPLLFVIGLTGFTGTLLPPVPRAALVEFLQRWDRRLRFSPLLLAAILIYSLTRWISKG